VPISLPNNENRLHAVAVMAWDGGNNDATAPCSKQNLYLLIPTLLKWSTIWSIEVSTVFFCSLNGTGFLHPIGPSCWALLAALNAFLFAPTFFLSSFVTFFFVSFHNQIYLFALRHRHYLFNHQLKCWSAIYFPCFREHVHFIKKKRRNYCRVREDEKVPLLVHFRKMSLSFGLSWMCCKRA
jgi:hypothetical protein